MISRKTRRCLVPVPVKSISILDQFWGRRLAVNRKVTLPAEYRLCKESGRINAWKLAREKGRPNATHIYWDSDVAKWMEAAACSLMTAPDRQMEAQLDKIVGMMARAQTKDGYLNSHYIAVEPENRWTNLRDCHELYCAGHLMEAAVAYFEATGKRAFLEVMCRYADHIDSVFGREKGKKRGYCGHPEIELALVKLYHATGNRRYLALSRYFVNERGRRPHYYEWEAGQRGEDPKKYEKDWKPFEQEVYDELQAHRPVRRQETAEGHAVRAMYLFCGMTDIAMETGDDSLFRACRKLWHNVVTRRMYVTGSVGSSRNGERFTFDYDLPNETSYAETCASIGLVFWAYRMLQADPKGEYADVMERALYNGVLSGVSLDGKRFFYANPLAVFPRRFDFEPLGPLTERREWFECACCPTNIARLLASFGQYIYSAGSLEIFVHLYVRSRMSAEVAGCPVTLVQKTGYPWKETVQIRIEPGTRDGAGKFTLSLRIPGWCRSPRIQVNGKTVSLPEIMRRGYARIARVWNKGDAVTLTLPMPVERARAHPKVRENGGRVALQRGPLVYCLEEADNGPGLNSIIIPASSHLHGSFDRHLPGGAVMISGNGFREVGMGHRLYGTDAHIMRPITIRAVPYALWNNRDKGEMLVWIREI